MGRHAGNRGNHKGFRATEETWEIFLGHVATMSAIEASKLPGMPSAPAFVKKRRRDPAFAARADTAMASRKLENSGRKRITPDQWAGFLQAVGSSCVHSLCQRPGMPSEAAVYKRRSQDRAFAAEIASTLRARLKIRLEAALDSRFPGRKRFRDKAIILPRARPLGEAFQARLSENALYSAVRSAIPDHLNPVARDDIAADMMLAVLEGQLDLADLKSRAKEFTRQHWKMFGTIGVISLDAPAGHGSKATIGDRLSGEASSFWG